MSIKIRSSLAALALAIPTFAGGLHAQRAPIPAEMQIRLAVQAAPPALRADATVQGWNADGEFVVLQEGDGPMVCLAPNPASEQFEVSCHHREIEPYFERGRELIREGITGNDRMLARWAEIESGDLVLPPGTSNHILTGTGFDPATGEIQGAFTRWVLYMPGVDGAALGLSEQPVAPGVPWVMFPGTPGAHVMITPPRGG